MLLRYEELYAPVAGPENPFKTQQQAAHKNTLAGYVEDAHVNAFQFETQRRTFHSYGWVGSFVLGFVIICVVGMLTTLPLLGRGREINLWVVRWLPLKLTLKQCLRMLRKDPWTRGREIKTVEERASERNKEEERERERAR